MWERTQYKDLDFSDEVKSLASINESFDIEPDFVIRARLIYADLFIDLIKLRDSNWRSEAGRNFSIAITELENSLIRTVKWFYAQK